MNGSQDVKLVASHAYCDVIRITPQGALGAYAVSIAGPLIRVLSDRV